VLLTLQENLIRPSVPELTLLCDGELGLSSPTAATCQQRDSYVTSGYSTSEQMQSAGCGAASCNIDAGSCVDGLSSASDPQPLIQSSGITQQIARKPQKLHQPTGVGHREDNTAPCCQHCASCQMKVSGVAPDISCVPDDRGRHQSGPHNMPCTARNVRGCTAPCQPTRVSMAPGSMQSSVLSAGSRAGSLGMHNKSALVTVSHAARVPTSCQACHSPAGHQAVTGQNVNSSALHAGSRHVVEAVPSPSLTASPHDPSSRNAQPVFGGPKPNGQFRQQPLPGGPRFVQATHQQDPRCEKASRSRGGHVTPQNPATPVRLPSSASQQTKHDSVPWQPRHMTDAQSSHLPLNVKCASRAGDLSGRHQCPSSVSPTVAAQMVQCTESHPFSTSVHSPSQHPGSKTLHSSTQPGAQLLGCQSSTDVCEQRMVYDSDQYVSRGKPASISGSEQADCEVDLQRLSSHSSTRAANVPVSSGPRTVNELLSTIPVQNMDWSLAVPPAVATVDRFVESVLGHRSASVDSGLQVNDSAVSDETPPKTLPALTADNCNGVLYDLRDCVTSRDDGGCRRPVNMKKCGNAHVDSDEYQQPGYVEDEPKVSEKFAARDDSPKLCSVAVNTSLYWPPADDGYAENWHRAACSDTLQNDVRRLISAVTGCNDTTARPAASTEVQSNHGCDSPIVVTASQRLSVGDGDVALLNGSSPGAWDSMADVSFCTPPPPPLMFPHPSDESVVSEMIMDMPEYTALSHEK